MASHGMPYLSSCVTADTALIPHPTSVGTHSTSIRYAGLDLAEERTSTSLFALLPVASTRHASRVATERLKVRLVGFEMRMRE